MENANIFLSNSLKGTYHLIAKRLGCTPTYVSMVLRNKLGKYDKRKTTLVKEIRDLAARIEEMLETKDNPQ